ncbi:MAG: hypothetical protein QT10_C0005G0009 [archaeon GW2011_AR19]|nr:MAG: hypothetical protein QT10_C0005G0009 [archaeon GW2011_AR19]
MIKAYASYFVSYLINNFKKIENISDIILFGSAAKGEAKKSSDIDFFIEVKRNSKNFEKEIIDLVNDFYKSREALIFKTKGIDNKINVIVGKLEDWADLRKSIESTGIVFYGNYIASYVKGKKHIIFFWDKIGKNRGAFLNKIYGFNSKGKRYIGLIENFNGRKLGKSSFMVPVEYREEIVKLFKHYKVNSKIIDVYV